MNDIEKIETKEKILKTASELFSKFGFNGTSVRDIAAASGVNVASINYHFGSKHNLYWSVVQESKKWSEKGFSEIAKRVDNVEDLIAEAFDFLMTDVHSLRTALKIMLTEGVPEPEGELKEAMEASLGPPGEPYIVEILKKQLGKNVSQKDLRFAVDSIFGSLLHWAFFSCCPKIEALKIKNPQLEPEEIKKTLRLQARATCQFIKSK